MIETRSEVTPDLDAAKKGIKMKTANERITIDGRIALTDICELADWHRATVIEELERVGLLRQEAEAFTSYAFGLRAKVRDPGECPDDFLTIDQWNRVDLG